MTEAKEALKAENQRLRTGTLEENHIEETKSKGCKHDFKYLGGGKYRCSFCGYFTGDQGQR